MRHVSALWWHIVWAALYVVAGLGWVIVKIVERTRWTR